MLMRTSPAQCEVICPVCKKIHYALPHEIARGERVNCSRTCAKTKSIDEKFWQKVDKTNSCWLWKGGKDIYGYGRLRVPGHNLLAHRISYELHHGPIPKEMLILHKCDNPPCVNPAHLFLGTQETNNKDAKSKGRSRGRFSHKSPLNKAM